MAKRGDSESLVVDVYESLRADIFDRRLSPGERLRPVELGARFSVSVGVAREALALLSSKGLVDAQRNRGFHVVRLSPEVLVELTDSRKLIEGEALRRSVANGGVAWESDLLAAHHRLSSEPIYLVDDPTTRSPAWAAHHIEFHRALISACGNTILLDLCARLSDSAELYRAWSVSRGETDRDIAGEHQALLEAALAHDADKAVDLFERHVDRTVESVLRIEGGLLATAGEDLVEDC